MNVPFRTAAASLLALALLAGAQGLQEARAQAAQPAAKPAAPAQKPAQQQRPAARPARPAQPAPLPAANDEQLKAAELTHFGVYECPTPEKLEIQLNPKTAGYVDVKFGKQTWITKPVLSSTGALRLEDVRGQVLLLQIANKSMLMDVKVGRRLADNCTHEKQRAFVPPADGGGIGIDPSKKQ
jgi:hypothetical protein